MRSSRKGIAAMVPLMLGMMIPIWAIMFWGGEINNLRHITNIYNTKNVQHLLVQQLAEKRAKLIKDGVTKDEATRLINIDLNDMINRNNIKTK